MKKLIHCRSSMKTLSLKIKGSGFLCLLRATVFARHLVSLELILLKTSPSIGAEMKFYGHGIYYAFYLNRGFKAAPPPFANHGRRYRLCLGRLIFPFQLAVFSTNGTLPSLAIASNNGIISANKLSLRFPWAQALCSIPTHFVPLFSPNS